MDFAALYLHIPFCLRKCNYCDFVSFPLAHCEEAAAQYAEAVIKEWSLWQERLAGSSWHSLYVGGGTPTSLPVESLCRILAALPSVTELTVEANPETVDAHDMQRLCQAGVNRLSLGAQSFDDRQLQALGRGHCAAQTAQAVAWARAAGIENINLDLIYGLPDQDLDSWRQSLAAALALQPTHLSLYALSIEPGCPWYEAYQAGKLQPADDDLAADMLELAMQLLPAAGYRHYEISNFARPGYESWHNSAYWRRQNYLGLGVAAASCYRERRWYNVSSWEAYRAALAAGRLPIFDEECLTAETVIAEAAFLGLRLRQGIDLAAFAAQYGVRLEQYYRRPIRRLVEQGLLCLTPERLYLSDRGVMLGNKVFCEFV